MNQLLVKHEHILKHFGGYFCCPFYCLFLAKLSHVNILLNVFLFFRLLKLKKKTKTNA